MCIRDRVSVLNIQPAQLECSTAHCFISHVQKIAVGRAPVNHQQQGISVKVSNRGTKVSKSAGLDGCFGGTDFGELQM